MHRHLRIGVLLIALSIGTAANASDVEWSGFGSAYYGQAFEKELRPSRFDDTSADFTNFSLFGLNVSTKMDEQWSAGAQFVTQQENTASNPSWNLRVKWAFVNYAAAANTNIKAGRQLFPTLMASEYETVHFLLPYREIPVQVASMVPFVGFDGVSVNHDMTLGEHAKLRVGVFGGRPIYNLGDEAAAAGISASAKDLLGAALTFDGEGYRLRAEVSRSHPTLTTATPFPIVGVFQTDLMQYSAGGRYDRHNIVVWGEWVRLQGDTDTDSFTALGNKIGGRFLKSAESAYALVGYRIGKFMPRYTFAWGDAQYGIANGHDQSHIIGVNYAAGTNAMVRLDYELIQVPNATTHSPITASRSSSTSTSTKDSGSAIYAGVDFVF